MRKFIALGLTAVTSATLAFSSVSPASAQVPGALTGQVCGALPAQLLGAVNGVATAVLAQTTAAADLLLKTTALNTGQADLVTALVAYIVASDAGDSVAAEAVTLSEKVTGYSDKAAAWANASSAVDTANRNVAISNLTNGFFTGLDASPLACPVI